jgi:hypothetical protein
MQIVIKVFLTILLLIIFFIFIRKIWTNEIDIMRWLKKPSDIIPVKEKTILPTIEPSITMLQSKYKPGVEVNGIIWERDFETHIFSIKNNSESTDILDLRIYIELPGAIITYKVLDSNGCQDLSLSQAKLPAGIQEKKSGLMKENIEYYINNISINAIKLFPKAKFKINILLSHIVKDHGGNITIKYRYLSPEGKYEKFVIGYPINYKDKQTNQLFINIENPITGEYEGHFLFIPKKKIIFTPNGSVQQ